MGSRIFLLLIVCSLSFSVSFSQDQQVSVKDKYILLISPQHLFIKGLKLELNKGVSDRKLVFVSPDYYSGKLTYSDSGSLRGFGLQAGMKYMLGGSPGPLLKYTFIGFSAQYNYFNINTNAFRWTSRVDNGLTYYDYTLQPVYRRFHRFGLDVFMGLLKQEHNRFCYEILAGASVRQSSMKKSENYFPANVRDEYSWDFGYTGIGPILNVKLGVIID